MSDQAAIARETGTSGPRPGSAWSEAAGLPRASVVDTLRVGATVAVPMLARGIRR